MDMAVEVQPSASQIPQAGPSTHANMLPPSPLIGARDENVDITRTEITKETIPAEAQPMPKTVPSLFTTLVESLQKQRDKGIPRPLRSVISIDIIAKDKKLYERAGVQKFSQYSALAEKAKIITLGGTQATAWISLHPDWCK
jgi:hypothetical protein